MQDSSHCQSTQSPRQSLPRASVQFNDCGEGEGQRDVLGEVHLGAGGCAEDIMLTGRGLLFDVFIVLEAVVDDAGLEGEVVCA